MPTLSRGVDALGGGLRKYGGPIALMMAGLSKDPNVPPRTIAAMGAMRKMKFGDEDRRLRDDTGKALQLVAQHDNLADAMGAIGAAGLQVDPKTLATLIQQRWKTDTATAIAIARQAQAMAAAKVRSQATLGAAGIRAKATVDAAKVRQGGTTKGQLTPKVAQQQWTKIRELVTKLQSGLWRMPPDEAEEARAQIKTLQEQAQQLASIISPTTPPQGAATNKPAAAPDPFAGTHPFAQPAAQPAAPAATTPTPAPASPPVAPAAPRGFTPPAPPTIAPTVPTPAAPGAPKPTTQPQGQGDPFTGLDEDRSQSLRWHLAPIILRLKNDHPDWSREKLEAEVMRLGWEYRQKKGI